MSYSRRSRYSRSPSYDRRSRSVSRSKYVSRSRSRSHDSSDAENPGNNLYVTGLPAHVRQRDIEKHFSAEGTVEDVHLVVDRWTQESRGFCFVTMSSVEEADRCIKYLNHSVLEGRTITVEKARRRRGRTPTPGKYLGLRTVRARRGSRSYTPNSRSHSPRYSSGSDRSRSRSYSLFYRQERRRQRSPSPHYSRHHYSRSPYSPYCGRGRSYSRSSSPYSRSPVSRRDRSYSPDNRYCPVTAEEAVTMTIPPTIIGVIIPILQMTLIIEEAATGTTLLSTVGLILQMMVTIEGADTVTTLLMTVIFLTHQMVLTTEGADMVATPLTIVTTIEGANIVPFLEAFHLGIAGPGGATHAVHHLGGVIQEVFPGVVTLIAVTLVQREALRVRYQGVAVLVPLQDLYQGLLPLGLPLLHHEEGRLCPSFSVVKGSLYVSNWPLLVGIF